MRNIFITGASQCIDQVVALEFAKRIKYRSTLLVGGIKNSKKCKRKSMYLIPKLMFFNVMLQI